MELPYTFPYVPWTIIRAMSYVKMIRGVHQRVQFDKEPESAMPYKWIWLDPKRVDAWFEQRKEDAKRNISNP